MGMANKDIAGFLHQHDIGYLYFQEFLFCWNTYLLVNTSEVFIPSLVEWRIQQNTPYVFIHQVSAVVKNKSK